MFRNPIESCVFFYKKPLTQNGLFVTTLLVYQVNLALLGKRGLHQWVLCIGVTGWQREPAVLSIEKIDMVF